SPRGGRSPPDPPRSWGEAFPPRPPRPPSGGTSGPCPVRGRDRLDRDGGAGPATGRRGAVRGEQARRPVRRDRAASRAGRAAGLLFLAQGPDRAVGGPGVCQLAAVSRLVPQL